MVLVDSISLPLSSMTGGATVLAFRPLLFAILVEDIAEEDEVKSSDEVVEVASTDGFPSSFSISTSSFSLSSAAVAAAEIFEFSRRFLPARFFSTGEADALRCAAMRFWSKYSASSVSLSSAAAAAATAAADFEFSRRFLPDSVVDVADDGVLDNLVVELLVVAVLLLDRVVEGA